MSSELKRRSDESKRSVFDRLGPDTKSASVNTTASSKITIKMSSVCPSYAKTGYCQLGSKCKYEHVRKGKDKDELRSKAAKKDKEGNEKINDQPKDSEAKIKSTIVSKSSDDSDKRTRKVVDTSIKTVKLSVKSPSPGLKKKKVDEQCQVKQKDKKSEVPKEESRSDQKYKNDEKSLDKSKQKRDDPLAAARNSSSSSKKTGNSILSPPSSSSKDGKSFEVRKHQKEEPHLKSHAKTSSDTSKGALTSKMESSRREEKKEVNSKDRKYGNNLTATSDVSSANAEHKIQKHHEKLKETTGSKVAAKTKKRQRSVSESTSSSSSSGSSSSSSGSSSGSSSRSSYTSNERSPLERPKRKEEGDKKAKSAKQILSDKQVVQKLEDGHKKATTRKHSREYSEDRLHERDEKVKTSRPKVDRSRGNKRDLSGSPSPRFNSPMAREREERYYSGRKQVDNERYVRMKIHDPEYEHDRGSLEMSHECRRIKVDPYLDKMSPAVEARRKESDYYREDYVRYRRDDEFESLDRRKSRERPPYDLPDKDALYSDEPIRRERLSRRGHWEQMETEDMTRSKHKRHLSNESYSPARKKKRSTPHDEYRDRSDKIYESEGRKKDYERDEDALLDDVTYKSRHRRSSHDSWHQRSKERRMRRDKSEHERSRERVRDDYYGRSPVESSDYSPRHRPEHSKRSGDYSSFDYDVDRGRRSLSRSSMGSKPPGRSRYYEGKRSLGGSGATVTAPHYQSSYEYRDSYHATPETDILEGRGFQAKPIYWDDYKRVDGPPPASFRGVPTHAHTRSSHISASTTVPPVDWEAGRMPGKQSTHEWDARYERSSEEFLSRKDNLLPPPPRPRLENSEVPSPPALAITSQTTPVEVPNVEPCQLLKAMSFELEGYEEIVDDELDECLAQEDEEDEAVGEKDGGHSTYDEEMENLPRKIPLVDMTDIEWQSLVKSDDLKTKATCAPVEHKFTDIIREIGVSRQYAGDELFEKINSILIEEIDEEQEEDIKVALNGASDDDDDDDDDDRNKNATQISEANINGSTIELKTEPKENGEEISSSAAQLSDETKYDSDMTEGRGHKDQEISDGLPEGKENKIVEVKLENCEPHYGTKSSSAARKKGPLLHDVANFHVTSFFKKKRQLSALRDIGPYRRALCARRDLAIRRTLCRIEKDEIVMFPAQLADQELYKLSLQLFHQNDKETQENSSAPLTLA